LNINITYAQILNVISNSMYKMLSMMKKLSFLIFETMIYI